MTVIRSLLQMMMEGSDRNTLGLTPSPEHTFHKSDNDDFAKACKSDSIGSRLVRTVAVGTVSAEFRHLPGIDRRHVNSLTQSVPRSHSVR